MRLVIKSGLGMRLVYKSGLGMRLVRVHKSGLAKLSQILPRDFVDYKFTAPEV